MTQNEFNRFPLLLTRQQVVEVGVSEKVIDEIAVVLTAGTDVVPFGRIGGVKINGGPKKLYRKKDVAVILGFEI